jgi:two-component system, LytTR family, response regulator
MRESDLKTLSKLLKDLNLVYMDRIAVKNQGRILILKTKDIKWMKAEGNYIRLHSGTNAYLLRGTLSGIASKLNPHIFKRIHRSIIVNINCVKELQPWFHGEYKVILDDGTQLMLTRNYKDALITSK